MNSELVIPSGLGTLLSRSEIPFAVLANGISGVCWHHGDPFELDIKYLFQDRFIDAAAVKNCYDGVKDRILPALKSQGDVMSALSIPSHPFLLTVFFHSSGNVIADYERAKKFDEEVSIMFGG